MATLSVLMNSGAMIFPETQASASVFSRPVKLLVKDQTFILDPQNFSKLSPIFDIMLFGKDSDSSTEIVREIVDEKSEDISVFLKCLEDPTNLNAKNFPIIIRLANKYQVDSLSNACENFLFERCDLNRMNPDQVVTLLVSANEFHLKKEVIVKLIMRLAAEDKNTYNRLKLSRLLTVQLYGAVIGTNLNLTKLKEIEAMNGHLFKLERNGIQYRMSPCDMCKRITDVAHCEGCCR